MSHGLILGMTESGKTTLAKYLASKLKKAGKKIIVFDSMNNPGWDCDYKAESIYALLWILKEKKWRQSYVFIDEASNHCGHHDKHAIWLATQSRHWGHSCFFITQRGSLLSKTIREQCSFLYLFSCSKSDAQILANEWNKEKLLESNTLKPGEFFYAPRFKEVEKRKINLPQRSKKNGKKKEVGKNRSAEVGQEKSAPKTDPEQKKKKALTHVL